MRFVLPPLLRALAPGGVVVWAQPGAAGVEAGAVATASLTRRVREHVGLCAVSTVLAVAAAVPAGVAATRPGWRRAGSALLFLANAGQSGPPLPALALAFSVTGAGF